MASTFTIPNTTMGELIIGGPKNRISNSNIFRDPTLRSIEISNLLTRNPSMANHMKMGTKIPPI